MIQSSEIMSHVNTYMMYSISVLQAITCVPIPMNTYNEDDELDNNREYKV